MSEYNSDCETKSLETQLAEMTCRAENAEAQVVLFRERIDVLEWLLEVEICVHDPVIFKLSRSTIEELGNTYKSARKAVEVKP